MQGRYPMGAASIAPLLLLLLAFSVLGPVLVLRPTYLAWRWGERSRSWPLALGKVQFSGTVFIPTGRGSGGTHLPWVVCAYSVNGCSYKCRRIEFGFRSGSSRATAERAAAPYVAGSEVPIHYNPGRPGMAVLKVGLQAGLLRSNVLYSALILSILLGG